MLQTTRDTDGERLYVFNNERFRNGFLHKQFSLKTLETNDVQPTLEELQAFQSNTDGGDDEDAMGVLLRAMWHA